ncbi:MAG: alpha/beta fold hydrolase [Silicimonas sp.]|nr:alpha/beta fold hydrolase [Silicimonas sp.]
MTFPWKPISHPFSEAADTHNIIVVGSGYGGGVAAARLARAGQAVTVLERGREIVPGKYPRNLEDGIGEFQITLSQTGTKLGKADGLYDLRINNDMNALVGCGVGGTSLINANVAIEPDDRVFANWPKRFRKKKKKPVLLAEYFDRARHMLGSGPYPAGRSLAKLTALEKIAKGMDAPFKRPDINVSFQDGHNAAGVMQKACTDCGDCVSGCNYGAKNTVLMNYLPYAERFGAMIYNGAEVYRLTQQDGLWQVHTRTMSGESLRVLTAKTVILAAGTLGTNEILLRSRSADLEFSDHLGQHFSGNGDVWAFGYNANMAESAKDEPSVIDIDLRPPVYCVGAGVHDVTFGPDKSDDQAHKPGPCITGVITLSDPDNLENSLIIEEGVVPGALAAAYAVAFPMMDALMGDVFRYGDTVERLTDAKTLADTIQADPLSLADTVYSGPVSRTLPYLVMSHDASAGRLDLTEYGKVTIDWDKAGDDAAIVHDEEKLRAACDTIQAEYLPNPLWQDAFGRRLVTVHPLGGCAMADSIDKGVINDKCQVFDPKGDVHKGLYVCDGAAMPRALGVNPLLTITAVAEHAMQEMADEHGWKIDLSDPDPLIPPMSEVGEPMPDPLAMLDGVSEGLTRITEAIDNQMWELARMMLRGLWRQIYDLYLAADPEKSIPFPTTEDFIKHLGDENALQHIIRPILGQSLQIIDPVRDALAKKDYATVLQIVEAEMGDFSPTVWFPERMAGHISAVALKDDPAPSDPYAVAGEGAENCVVTADVLGKAVKSATAVPDGTAKIVNGKVSSDVLGGTFSFNGQFRFLMPDPDHIERWEMTYEGPLVATGESKPRYHFRGFKSLQRREGSHWWRDLTELRVEIRESDETGPVVAMGMLTVGFEDLIEQANALTFEYRHLYRAALAAYLKVSAKVPDKMGDLPDVFADHGFRANCVKTAILAADTMRPDMKAADQVAGLYRGKVFARMGGLVARAYGGIFSYMANFPAIEAGPGLSFPKDLGTPEYYYPEPDPGVFLKLTRFKGGTKGPVILANGFGTKASSFATPTVEENVVQTLYRGGYDVWLFDYRGSGDIEASLQPFDLDDVAQRDWPSAIDLVTDITGQEKVQVLVHCVGSMTLFMAVLAGEERVRSIISSQLSAHAITNWFKFAQADSRTAGMLANGLPRKLWGLAEMLPLGPDLTQVAKTGLPNVDPRSPSQTGCSQDFDHAVDGMLWKVPAFAPVPCYSPTCHRINFIFGPSYRHAQLNQETHNSIAHMFGPVSSTPFLHLARIFRTGHPVSADGETNYLDHPERLSMPIHFFAGGRNQEMLPEATLRTLTWLETSNNRKGASPYTRKVYPDYGHMDCFIGKTAHLDIFQDLCKVLDQTR